MATNDVESTINGTCTVTGSFAVHPRQVFVPAFLYVVELYEPVYVRRDKYKSLQHQRRCHYVAKIVLFTFLQQCCEVTLASTAQRAE